MTKFSSSLILAASTRAETDHSGASKLLNSATGTCTLSANVEGVKTPTGDIGKFQTFECKDGYSLLTNKSNKVDEDAWTKWEETCTEAVFTPTQRCYSKGFCDGPVACAYLKTDKSCLGACTWVPADVLEPFTGDEFVRVYKSAGSVNCAVPGAGTVGSAGKMKFQGLQMGDNGDEAYAVVEVIGSTVEYVCDPKDLSTPMKLAKAGATCPFSDASEILYDGSNGNGDTCTGTVATDKLMESSRRLDEMNAIIMV